MKELDGWWAIIEPNRFPLAHQFPILIRSYIVALAYWKTLSDYPLPAIFFQ